LRLRRRDRDPFTNWSHTNWARAVGWFTEREIASREKRNRHLLSKGTHSHFSFAG
jgi:hypothetical protein